jgi:hypothetical protein
MGHLLVALLVSLAPQGAPEVERGSAARTELAPVAAATADPPAHSRGAGAVATPAAAHPDPAHLAELLGRARSLRLWEDPGWLRLGHWRPTRKGGFESEVDGMAFFRALRGKTDPRAELEATLRALFDDRPVADELSDAMCRYPARFAFLAGKLGVDLARLPPRRCERFEAFLARIHPRSVTLVFSSYYLNNPASAFGHTFLRLNKDDAARAGKEWELLDYGIDYSATVDTGNAVLYALRGLLGSFKGEFRNVAYYYKVREYADSESRDLWEYDLALTPGEVAMLSGHLWELGATYFDYWYLDENCSYHILGALEAAAPRLSLLEHVGRYVVVPADTVKALFANPGLVRGVSYRPSIRTQFVSRLARLDAAGQDAVEALAASPAAPLPPSLGKPGEAAVLDAALDHLDLRFGRDLAVGKAPEAARARQTLLERRSALAIVSPPLDLPPPPRRAPELGHASARMAAGGGYSTKEGGLVLLDVRLALHDLGDPADGYPPLSQIEFLPGRLRFAPRELRGEVDELWLARIAVLNDLTRFELRPSWRVRFGLTTVRDRGCDACLAGQVEFGAGFAKTLGPLDLYGGADVAVEAASHLEGYRESAARLGVGPGGTVRLRIAAPVVLVADGRWRFLPESSPRETFDLRAALRLHVAKGLSLSLEARRTPSADEGSLAVQAFY